MSYADLLRHPKWQRKRLEILERDGFECTHCGSKDTELHVHHEFYDRRKPWEYPNDSLRTLCKGCHQWHEDLKRRLMMELPGADIELLLGVAYATAAEREEHDSFPCTSYGEAWGIGLVYGISAKAVIAAIEEGSGVVLRSRLIDAVLKHYTEILEFGRKHPERDRLPDHVLEVMRAEVRRIEAAS